MSAFVQPGAGVPALETERLILRAHRPDDLAESAAMWADPAVTRHIGGVPMPREAVWGKLLRYAGHWLWLGYGYWAIEEKATGALIGEVGLADGKREMEPSLEGMPEIGWALASDAHGKGLGTEAVRAALAWFDARAEPTRTACIIHPDNTASIRIANRFGYRETARTTYKDQPTIVFVRPAS
jgi:RimJ/RimL family protein N-acetyltransferase